MADRSLDDCQDLVGRIRSELPFWIIQVPQIPLTGLPDLRTYAQHSRDTALHIGVHLSLIIRGVIHGVVMGLLQQFFQPAPAPGHLRFFPRLSLAQAGRRQAQLGPQSQNILAQLVHHRVVGILGGVDRSGFVDQLRHHLAAVGPPCFFRP